MRKVLNVSKLPNRYKVRDDPIVHPMARGKIVIETSRDGDFVHYRYADGRSDYIYRQRIPFFYQCTIPIP